MPDDDLGWAVRGGHLANQWMEAHTLGRRHAHVDRRKLSRNRVSEDALLQLRGMILVLGILQSFSSFLFLFPVVQSVSVRGCLALAVDGQGERTEQSRENG